MRNLQTQEQDAKLGNSTNGNSGTLRLVTGSSSSESEEAIEVFVRSENGGASGKVSESAGSMSAGSRSTGKELTKAGSSDSSVAGSMPMTGGSSNSNAGGNLDSISGTRIDSGSASSILGGFGGASGDSLFFAGASAPKNPGLAPIASEN